MHTLMCIKLMTNKNLLYKKINKLKSKNQKKKVLTDFPFFWTILLSGVQIGLFIKEMHFGVIGSNKIDCGESSMAAFPPHFFVPSLLYL